MGMFAFNIRMLTKISISLGALIFMDDFLSLFFILLIGITALPVIIYSFGYLEEYRKNYSIKYFWVIIMVFLLSMAAVVLSQNGISFIVFWEIMSVSSFFLVIFEYKKKENIKSGIMYFIMAHISGLLLMVMFVFIWKYTGTFDFRAFNELKSLGTMEKSIILILAFLGFGTKAGLVPLHPWLPKAHPSAPSNVSALMSGVMLKIALYGFIRVCFFINTDAPLWFALIVMASGALTAIFGVINGLFQNDIKKLLAFSSVENIGLIFSTLGLSLVLRTVGNEVLSNIALTAAVLHILNHGIFKSLLFMGAGSVHFATSTRNMNELGGLYNKMKFAAICTFIGTLGLAAIPPLNGFASEILIFISFIKALNFASNPALALAIILTGIVLALTSGCVLWAMIKSFGTVFLGEPRSEKAKKTHDITKSMKVGMGISGFYTVALGVLSPFVINYIYKGISKTKVNNIVGYEITIVSAMLIVAFLITYIYTKKTIQEQRDSKETWGCGFNNLKYYNQYSPNGFVQPAVKFFGDVVSFKKEVNIKESIFIKGRIKDVIETNLYLRVTMFVNYIASRIIKIHYGKIQVYVSYIFISLVISLVLVIKFL